MAASNGSVLTVDHSVSPKGAIDGEYRHAWRPGGNGDELLHSGKHIAIAAGTEGAPAVVDLGSFTLADDDLYYIAAGLAASGDQVPLGIAADGVGVDGVGPGIVLYTLRTFSQVALFALNRNLTSTQHLSFGVYKKVLP